MKHLETRKESLARINKKIDQMIKRGTDKRKQERYLELCNEQYIIWKANKNYMVLA